MLCIFFFFLENEQCETWFPFSIVFLDYSFFSFSAASRPIFSFFSLAIKKKKKKKKPKFRLGTKGYVAKVSPHTRVHRFVRQTLFFYFLVVSPDIYP